MSTEHDVIARMQAGDEAAAAELYDRHGGVLLALAYRILGDRADAEDVLVETLARAWRKSVRFDARRGSVGAWLTVMVRTRALDLVRARRRRERVTGEAARGNPEPLVGVSMTTNDPAATAEHSECREHVRAALSGLPETQRTAIELAYFGGLSQSEIAERLGTPLGTVKTRIRDGMQKLRAVLRPLYAEHGT